MAVLGLQSEAWTSHLAPMPRGAPSLRGNFLLPPWRLPGESHLLARLLGEREEHRGKVPGHRPDEAREEADLGKGGGLRQEKLSAWGRERGS